MFWCMPGGQTGAATATATAAAAAAASSEVGKNLFAGGSGLHNPLVPLASCEQRYSAVGFGMNIIGRTRNETDKCLCAGSVSIIQDNP